MRLLSIDVGIKNLAICLLDVVEPETTAVHRILVWDVVDICHSDQENADIAHRASNRPKCAKCSLNAAFFYYKDNVLQLLCKRHSTKMRESEHLLLATTDFNLSEYKKVLNGSTAKLYAFCQEHDNEWTDVTIDTAAKSNSIINPKSKPKIHEFKTVMQDRVRHIARTRYLHAYDEAVLALLLINPNPTNTTANTNSNTICMPISKSKSTPEYVSLITVGSNLMTKLDKLFYSSEASSTSSSASESLVPDRVIIENQISPIATRMKTVQGMLTQYFLVRGVDPANISFISAANKLKSSLVSSLSDPTELDDNAFTYTYSDRKKMGIACVRKLFKLQQQQQALQLDNATAPYWNQVFESHKKKDDMADSLLQALSYLKK